jgi:phosphate transport system substrate-binding protein
MKPRLVIALLSAALAAAPAPLRSGEFNLENLRPYVPRLTVEGRIRTWGDPLPELMKNWEEGFHRFQPAVQFEDTLMSTALAVPGLATGVADLGLMGREIWPMEILGFQRVFKSPPVTIEVASGTYDVPFRTWAIIVFVNKDNPISKLTMRQLDGIFGSQRSGGFDAQKLYWLKSNGRGPGENIRTWGQLGLTGEWQDKPIHVYGFDFMRNGISTGFAEKVFKGGDKWNEGLVEFEMATGPDGKVVAPEYQSIEALGRDPYGITYDGIQYKTPLVKPVALAFTDAGPYVMPSKATVQDRSYPLLRSLYMHAIRDHGKPLDPKVKEFLRFILSREGQQAVADTREELPLTAEVVEEQLKKLD